MHAHTHQVERGFRCWNTSLAAGSNAVSSYRSMCQAVCGDGLIAGLEACDSSPGCSPNCTFLPFNGGFGSGGGGGKAGSSNGGSGGGYRWYYAELNVSLEGSGPAPTVTVVEASLLSSVANHVGKSAWQVTLLRRRQGSIP